MSRGRRSRRKRNAPSQAGERAENEIEQTPAMQATTAHLERHARQIDRLGQRIDDVSARAERGIDDELAQATLRAEQADALATLRMNETDQRRRDAADRVSRRRAELVAGEPSARPKLGAIARVGAWLTAWRRRRRHRGMLHRLDRGLARGEARIADHRAAALLAVLTERIALLSSTTASPAQLDETITMAQHLSDEYRAYVVRLTAARDTSGATPALRDKATAELSRCEAGARRIDDALGQLRALARRRAPPDR